MSSDIDIPSAVSLIHQLIEKWSLTTPDAPAISYNGKILSYKALNEKSNQLAHFLKAKGIQAETLVGISLERSLEMIIGLIAILKAGGAYVPIDPDYPEERINFILSDSRIHFLLTQKSLMEKYSNLNVKKIYLDNDWEEIALRPPNNLASETHLDNLAYVLYTSGTTGNPKGIMVCHRNLIHACSGWQVVYDLKNTDCHLQMASFSFDVFSGDLIRSLCFGAKLVLCPKDILLNPEKLYKLMVIEKINCAEFVPTVLRKLMEYVESSVNSLVFMRLLICGSDNWSMNEYRKLRKLGGTKARVINSYGLTEATIDSTYFEEELLTHEHFSADHAVPIGKPFPNTEIYLLDESLNIVPNGARGEIYIGGSGLARGYLNLPDLTAQKFIKHPFNNDQHAKLYKTGDQGRYLSDGNIEFLGRIDSQIKLRGLRIELSDIENALNCHPCVRESLVTVYGNETQHKRLVAYIVEHEPIADLCLLSSFLCKRLPAYMVPSLFIRLNTLPITPNGKLDRQTLKTTADLLFNENYIAPGNCLEAQLVELWNKLTGTERTGVLDNLFDRGGDSILLAQLVTEIEKQFSVSISPCEIFKMFTISKLAQFIDQNCPSKIKN